jgi:two-component sensor histidine kinase
VLDDREADLRGDNVQTILSPDKVKRIIARMPYKQVRTLQAVAAACILVAVATGARFALGPMIGDGFAFITFFPVVLVATVVAGPASGLSSLVLSSIVTSYFWLSPTWSFALTSDALAALAAYWFASALMIAVATLLRVIVAHLVESEARAHVLAHEMKHRVGNVLAVIQAIARQTSRGRTSLEEFNQVFQDRLAALARAQDVIQENPNFPTNLRQLVERITQPFGQRRFVLGGPHIGIDPVTASSLALLIHELGTNAMKYGALSNATGTVSLSWMKDGDRVVATWIENGGPAVTAPARSGFGSKLLQTAFPPDVGEARIDYAEAGVRCSISFGLAAPIADAPSVGSAMARATGS